MKKLIAALLALSLLLSGLCALAEREPTAFEDVGIAVDFEDVTANTDSYIDLVQIGIIHRDPFISCLCLEYYAMDKESWNEMVENFDTYDEEMKTSIQQVVAGIRADLAYVIVTDSEEAEETVRAQFGELPAGAEIICFGEVEPYQYYVVTMPGFEVPEDYESFAQYDMDPEEVRQAYADLQADTDAVCAAFVERLETAELFAPVDPQASLPGQILSFETTDLDGNVVTSTDLFKDNKITMVNLWGTWCQNCVGEMAELVELYTRLREKGCGIVGVEWEQKPIDTMLDEARAFLEEKGVNYPNVIMPEDNAILNQVRGYPTTFFVDSEGRILTIPISGALVDQYERTVDQLLSGEQVDAVTDAGAVKNDSGEYRVIVYDLNGNPVEGAVIQLCDDVTCAFQPTDANGVAVFSVAGEKAYDVHVLMVPEGYAPDEGEYKTLDTYSDVNIFLEKTA